MTPRINQNFVIQQHPCITISPYFKQIPWFIVWSMHLSDIWYLPSLHPVHTSIYTLLLLYCNVFAFNIGALALKMKHKAFHSTQNRKHTRSLHPTQSGPDIPPSPVLALCYSCSSTKHTHTHTHLPSFQLRRGLVYQQRPRSRSSPTGSQSKPPSGEPFLQA